MVSDRKLVDECRVLFGEMVPSEVGGILDFADELDRRARQIGGLAVLGG